jgi:hypothetical protein
MNCGARSCQTDDRVPQPAYEPESLLSPSVRREAAIQYLRAANRSADGRERESLRRRAADLILPRPR